MVGIGEVKDVNLGKACWIVVVESSVRRIADASVIEYVAGSDECRYKYFMFLGIRE